MPHPLLKKDMTSLRSKALDLIRKGVLFPRKSNIIFICGGNGEENLRPRFIKYLEQSMHKFRAFQPEYAIGHVLSEVDEPFNLSNFETLIGHLSVAIVIFPEAAGSYAEAGYFSANANLAKKSILVLNQKYAATDSFLSIGPARLISERTIFHPLIHLDYEDPNFRIIVERIQQRIGSGPNKKGFEEKPFKELNQFDKFNLIFCIFWLLQSASIDDVVYIIKALFSNRVSDKEIRSLSSVLIGAKILKGTDDEGNYAVSHGEDACFSIRDGFRKYATAIKIEIAGLLHEQLQQVEVA